MGSEIIFLSISCTIMIINSVFGDVPKCNREMSLIENFDSMKMAGNWNIMFTGNEQKSKKSCMKTTNDAQVGKLIIEEVGFVEGKNENLIITVTQIGSTSEFVAESKEFPLSSVWVVSTDYSSYAVWFLCINGHKQDGITFICTRDEKPSNEVLKKAQDALLNAELMIGEDYLFPVDHSNC
nr:uncharacterized protein LOC111423664 isoform X1 [Onthophagus taurus]